MIINKLKRWKNFSTKVKSSFYLTTPIFYVNANPHIGHLYSAVIADAINRYHRLRFPQSSVHFSTGTDEHGTKIQQAASRHNVPVDQYCADISSVYKQTFRDANVDYCDFIRTTDERHKLAVAHFWQLLKSRGHIYDAQYSGWYCISDEMFLTESQLKTDSTNGVRYSIESGHPVEWTEETNYMFKLSKFQNDILHWVKQGGRIRPEKFEKILLNYLSEPLLDISVSRPSNRVQWAISVPDDDTQTVYVWFDALVNYLTSVGYPNDDFKSQWPPNVQVIGKDILKFHGIYWPAFLIAAGLEPPQQLFVHSHWTVDGQKMSKSKFNVVDPQEAARIYTMEGLRYFLLREGVSHSDGNFSNIKAIRVLNSELADTLGNLLSRGCAKSLNPRQIHPRIYANHLTEISQLDATKRLMESLAELPGRCKQHYDENNFYMVVDTVISTLHAANNFFETCKPWELKKTTKALNHIKNNNNNNNAQKLETIISMTMDTLRLCGIILQPIIPELSGKLLNKLNVPASRRSWQNLNESFLNNVEFEERPLGDSDAILFNRIIQNDQRNENEQTKKQPAALIKKQKTKKVKNIQ